MATPLDLFPNIKQAALEIAYDNPFIDIQEIEIIQLITRANSFLGNLPVIKLIALDMWLGGLSPNDLSVACAGEKQEMQEVMATAPDYEFAQKVLEEIFYA